MSDKLFLYDYTTSNTYTYRQIIADLNSVSEVYEYCCTRDLYAIFLNIITAVAQNVNLILLDSDFSDLELQNLNIDSAKIMQSIPVKQLNINSTDELICKLQNNPDWKLTLFTSGTTGIPKKVVHKLISLTRAVRISERHSDDIWGFAYNPTHIAGLQVFFQALLNANTLVNIFEAERTKVLELIKNFNITNISATPTFFRLLLPLQEEYPSVKKLTSGGEKFDSNLSNNLLAAFPNARLRNVYASTEAGTILEAKGDTFTIKDESLCRIVDGELYIHKSLLGEGTALALEDGEWYATGDLVDVIENNPISFRFQQRKNEMINVGGYKVNPYEVEQALEKHPFVKQAYIYGKSNAVLGNILMADIVVTEALSERELREYLAPLLQPFKIPRVIHFVESIELTRTGKLKRT